MGKRGRKPTLDQTQEDWICDLMDGKSTKLLSEVTMDFWDEGDQVITEGIASHLFLKGTLFDVLLFDVMLLNVLSHFVPLGKVQWVAIANIRLCSLTNLLQMKKQDGESMDGLDKVKHQELQAL